MMGTRNPNHRPPLVEKVIVEDKPVIEDAGIIKDDFIALTKKEQVEKLEQFGLTKVEIRKLKKEQDRVAKLMELTEAL